ncbi:hypothetical protein GCM10008959_41610 [Deinococcus seoulensis]|uniref:Uncharacterized protein n=1 Tax=Deinococcus seoulensis TaxID=1837379 RepID=A0ABQ2S0J6_9DEIO|nr:hypothetical protein GCM10008959_41610 [Deinococcus seoulensis]
MSEKRSGTDPGTHQTSTGHELKIVQARDRDHNLRNAKTQCTAVRKDGKTVCEQTVLHSHQHIVHRTVG